MSGKFFCLICIVLVSLGVLVNSCKYFYLSLERKVNIFIFNFILLDPTITTKHIIDPNSLNDYNLEDVKFINELGSPTRGLVSDLPALPAVPKLPAMPTPLELLIKHPEVAGLALGALG